MLLYHDETRQAFLKLDFRSIAASWLAMDHPIAPYRPSELDSPESEPGAQFRCVLCVDGVMLVARYFILWLPLGSTRGIQGWGGIMEYQLHLRLWLGINVWCVGPFLRPKLLQRST